MRCPKGCARRVRVTASARGSSFGFELAPQAQLLVNGVALLVRREAEAALERAPSPARRVLVLERQPLLRSPELVFLRLLLHKSTNLRAAHIVVDKSKQCQASLASCKHAAPAHVHAAPAHVHDAPVSSQALATHTSVSTFDPTLCVHTVERTIAALGSSRSLLPSAACAFSVCFFRCLWYALLLIFLTRLAFCS